MKTKKVTKKFISKKKPLSKKRVVRSRRPSGKNSVVKVWPGSPSFIKITQIMPAKMFAFSKTAKSIMLHRLPPRTSLAAVIFCLMWGMGVIIGGLLAPKLERFYDQNKVSIAEKAQNHQPAINR